MAPKEILQILNQQGSRVKQCIMVAFKSIIVLCGTYLSLVFNTQSAVFFVQAFKGNNKLAAACIAVLGLFVSAGLALLLFRFNFLEKLYSRLREHTRQTQILLLMLAMLCAGTYIAQFFLWANENIAYLNNAKAWWFHLPYALGIVSQPAGLTLPQWLLSLVLFIPLSLFYMFLVTSLFQVVKSVLMSLSKYECRFLFIAAAAALLYVVFLYNSTSIYYGGMDRIYSFDSLPDSSYLINPFYYWSYYQYPLQPNLSLPLMMLAELVPDVFLWTVIARTLVQLWLLLIAFIMLSRMISENPRVRLLTLLIFSFSFPTMILAVITERRVITLAFVLIAIYQSLHTKRDEKLWLCAASGTVICNAYVLLLAVKPKKSFLKDILLCGLTFVFLAAFLGKISGLLDLQTQINNFKCRGWLDGGLDIGTKLTHYLNFVRSSFLAPLSQPSGNNSSWMMTITNTFSPIGICILLGAVCGFIVNYKNRLAQVAFAGVLASFFFIFIKSLNIAENAVVLNTLFFGWGFVTLVIMAADKLLSGMRIKYWALSGIAVGCFVYNVIAVIQLYKFGVAAYPV
ncbi:MAG: hypothetical protein PHR24_02955 [Oscillospiraceae bacterium]|nr:hypothetical protein [Oscillospiraceae bacterium]MDD4546238.1 hypothetical protein [Oscillospiraceae bacterium]